MRLALLSALAASALLVPAAAVAESPTTTRIETRPFYGATVTLEEGVRVFRPLPPHGRVIMNPGGATPLNLSYEERRSISHNYNYGNGTPGDGAYAAAGAYGPVHGSRRPHPHQHGSGFRAVGGHHR